MALPDATAPQARLLTVNINDAPPSNMGGVTIIPLFLDRENGVWVIYGKFAPGTTLPTHYHTGAVHFFTTKGRWNYLEHAEDPQTEGSYLYEPGGSAHTFSVPADAPEAAEGFMIVYGANVNFIDGQYLNITDAASLEKMFADAAKAGLMAMPKYFRPGGASST